MNKIQATIDTIETHEGITRIVLTSGEKKLTAITLELSSVFKVGNKVNVLFKETEVGIAKNLSGLMSFSNLFRGVVLSVNKGTILSRISMDVDEITIGSIITTNAVEKLALHVEDEVDIFVKATEVSLEEIV